uniref:Uncharacterized protein n=1 Tax=Hyaloperonospora arabidopsidis (strain Emoy2) TaxID=559515 RepID=M4B2F7_HYAAE
MARVGRSQTVESYLRKFRGDETAYSEILEITLCYGIQCLSRAFPFHGGGLTCSDLRTITGYEAAKKHGFYVRKGSRFCAKNEVKKQQYFPENVRFKPSHAWRDGEVGMPDFSEPSAMVTEAAADLGVELRASCAVPPPFDEIDYFTKLLGESLVDLAWQAFAGRKRLSITTKQELDELLFRVDQKKTAALVPALKLPLVSFAEFMAAYVMECVRQTQRTRTVDKVHHQSGDFFVHNGERASTYARRETALDSCSFSIADDLGQSVSASCAAIGTTCSVESATVDTRWKPSLRQSQIHPKQTQRTPVSLQDKQSSIQSELHTQRQKLLRVEKARTQELADSGWTAEYKAQSKPQDARDRHLTASKWSSNGITTGAAALEIVDDFIRSPLMDKFGRGKVSVSCGIMPSVMRIPSQIGAAEDTT